MRNTRNWIRALAAAIVLVPLGVLVWLNTLGYRSATVIIFFEPLIMTSRLANNLHSHNGVVVATSLGVLENRKSALGEARARQLLVTSNAWCNGALYLASLGDKTVVPYLIKGLRASYASGLYREMARRLRELTGEAYGTDFGRWHEWWLKQHPDSTFDFDSFLSVPISAGEL